MKSLVLALALLAAFKIQAMDAPEKGGQAHATQDENTIGLIEYSTNPQAGTATIQKIFINRDECSEQLGLFLVKKALETIIASGCPNITFIPNNTEIRAGRKSEPQTLDDIIKFYAALGLKFAPDEQTKKE